MKTEEFLKTVVTTDEGHFCLATREQGQWTEHFYSWPNDLDKIVAASQEASDNKSDVYFSAHLFSEQRSKKQFVLPSRTIQADLDHASTATLPVLPTILVQTSPGRHQGYWIINKAQSISSLETLGRRIAYSVPDCDKTGWTAEHKVRLPGTHNLKYPRPHFIEVAGIAIRPLELDAFEIFPDSRINAETAQIDIEWANQTPDKIEVPALELLAVLKGRINPKAYLQFNKPAKDRSAALWLLNCEAFRAGCSRDQVYHLALNSANNKFDDRKYNGITDLRKDILRAEQYISTRQVDLKALIMDLRQLQGELVSSRRKKMAELVVNHMREKGEFIHCKGGALYYLRRDTGRPIFISTFSEWLQSYLMTTFGLNQTEQEHKYVVQELVAYTRNLPPSNNIQTLSYFNTDSNSLYLHTGARNVLDISRSNITTHPNGYNNTVFQWGVLGESFSLDSDLPETYEWWNEIFDGTLYNLIGIERHEAVALLRAWVLFLLFRNIATTRPILAFFGQPGGGKTTFAKIIYRLLYGRFKSLSGINEAEDFDMDVASMPFVTFDNCDTWQAWLPDRLAQSAGNTAISRRKLYTDFDVILIDRQALVAVTAHDPKFAREDITDRLILFMHQRLEVFKSETEILDRISNIRNQLWTGIVRDVQKTLSTPKPSPDLVPQFRIEDFSRLGYWFSVASSPKMAQDFTSGIAKVQSRQRSLSLDSDYTLVAALRRYVEKRPTERAGEYLPVSVIWTHLSNYAPDIDVFKRIYRTPQVLGRKLWVMQESLKTLFDIACQDSPSIGARVWRIDPHA